MKKQETTKEPDTQNVKPNKWLKWLKKLYEVTLGEKPDTRTDVEKLFDKYGVDYQDTMNRFLNDETLYIEFLDMMYRDDLLTPLERMLMEEKDRIGAFEAAHALQVAAYHLGLVRLCRAVNNFMRFLSTDKKLEDHIRLYRIAQIEYFRGNLFHVLLRGGPME